MTGRAQADVCLGAGLRRGQPDVRPPEAGGGLACAGVAVEPRGDSAVIAVGLDAQRVLVEAGRNHGAREGDRVHLGAAEESLHLFNALSGRSLVPAASLLEETEVWPA